MENTEDIEELKRRITELEKELEVAKSANEAKSDFLSTVSHELRTPLNAILGIAEMNLQRNSFASDFKGDFERIYSSGDMLLGLINNILDISKIEAGRLELYTDVYEIPRLISDTAQLNLLHKNNKSINFKVIVENDTARNLVGDELRIKQILNNLLTNAFKYTSSGEVMLNVYTYKNRKDPKETMLVLQVSDTGQGMTPAQVNKIFDKFARFNPEINKNVIGVGMGMSITQDLIKMMNGEISVESKEGLGTTVTVVLPQGTVSDEIVGSVVSSKIRQFRLPGTGYKKSVQVTKESMPYGKVLVVDDVEINLYVAKGLLEQYDLNIDTATSGYETIDKISKGNRYDIIFMDHMMDGMDGIETTQILRTQMNYKAPIVALTANAVYGQSEIFLKNEFDDFISKPVDIRDMHVILLKYIRDKHPAKAAISGLSSCCAPLPTPLTIASFKQDQNQCQNEEGSSLALRVFSKDAEKSIYKIESTLETDGLQNQSNLRAYTIAVHGMKGALAQIGQMEIAKMASELEELARKSEVPSLYEKTPAFLQELRELVANITASEDIKDAQEAQYAEEETVVRIKLEAIKQAAEDFDPISIDTTLASIRALQLNNETSQLLQTVSNYLLHSEFEEIERAVGEFLDN